MRSSGVIKRPHFVVVYGPDNAGKTSFALGAPKPLLLETERGSGEINVERDTLSSYAEVESAFQKILSHSAGYDGFQTLVFDSLDHLTKLIYAHVCATVKHPDHGTKVASIEGYGYGKGYVFARQIWDGFIDRISQIREGGMNIILIAHSQTYTVDSPDTTGNFKQIDLKLPRTQNNDIAALFREVADSVLFLSKKFLTPKDDIRALDAGRVLRTTYAPGWTAKNRFGLPEEIELPHLNNRNDLSRLWSAYTNAVEASRIPGGANKAALLALAERVPDDTTRSKAIEAINGTDDAAKLSALAVRLNKVIEKGVGSAPAPAPITATVPMATSEEI